VTWPAESPPSNRHLCELSDMWQICLSDRFRVGITDFPLQQILRNKSLHLANTGFWWIIGSQKVLASVPGTSEAGGKLTTSLHYPRHIHRYYLKKPQIMWLVILWLIFVATSDIIHGCFFHVPWRTPSYLLIFCSHKICGYSSFVATFLRCGRKIRCI
jgi:hypothetical protein